MAQLVGEDGGESLTARDIGDRGDIIVQGERREGAFPDDDRMDEFDRDVVGVAPAPPLPKTMILPPR
ncbi:hypothetical protein [Allosalinactinospora lopnorensis]|uniref:hypothetical protein n=1 Tax=Allosalinactinospora lopnorensis TaxID=1352348 RepID=UPI001F3F1986|nr:hypothetical protein [Allosalinactinospora lopnorensis]